MNDYPASITPVSAQESQLILLMETYGDAILRTCYLLCDDLPRARQAAQRIFLRAASESRCGDFLFLLRLTCVLCPVSCAPHRFFCRRDTLSRLMCLPPKHRRTAILCLYHKLNIEEISSILRISPRSVARYLRSAKRWLFNL